MSMIVQVSLITIFAILIFIVSFIVTVMWTIEWYRMHLSSKISYIEKPSGTIRPDKPVRPKIVKG